MTDRSRLLHRPLPTTWWLGKRNYIIFILRELSAVFVALVAIGTVIQVQALSDGQTAYAGYQAMLDSPALIILSVVALLFALLHTITWFLLAGRVLVIPVGEKTVPKRMIVAGHFLMWIVISIVFACIVT
jgi:fumarate reductase subunit C